MFIVFMSIIKYIFILYSNGDVLHQEKRDRPSAQQTSSTQTNTRARQRGTNNLIIIMFCIFSSTYRRLFFFCHSRKYFTLQF